LGCVLSRDPIVWGLKQKEGSVGMPKGMGSCIA